MRFGDIKASHLQKVINDCPRSAGTKKKIKVLFNQMYDYAIKNDLANKNYSQFIKVPKDKDKTSKEPFSYNEIQKLWDNVSRDTDIELILIQIYTGLRPGELIIVENEKIYIEDRYFVAGFKTEAGTDRKVPINRKIEGYISKRISTDNKYLIQGKFGEHMSYSAYRERFLDIMAQLGMKHSPHECRHTFFSLMDTAGANSLATKRIGGHAGKDLTEKVYTHKEVEELIHNIDLI